MAKINDTTTYPTATPAAGDLMIGTDISNTTNDANGETVNFTIQGVSNWNEINAQTGTTYTLVLGDRAKTVTMNNASSNTLTIPTNASVAFPTGTAIVVRQIGAGTTTISATTGVTLDGTSAGSAAISSRYKAAVITKIDSNTWYIDGAVGAVS